MSAVLLRIERNLVEIESLLTVEGSDKDRKNSAIQVIESLAQKLREKSIFTFKISIFAISEIEFSISKNKFLISMIPFQFLISLIRF